MNTKILMAGSAVLMGCAGIILTFLPDEIAHTIATESNITIRLLIQILGGFYFAFAMLNWMVKSSPIGGIYNRPIVVANFCHFFIAGLALLKGLISHPDLPYGFWLIAGIYALFAIFFGFLFFRNPIVEQKSV